LEDLNGLLKENEGKIGGFKWVSLRTGATPK